MRKLLRYFLIPFLCLSLAHAQNFVIFQQTQQQNVLINQNYFNYSGNEQTRQILNTLSTEWQKSIYQTEYTLFFSYELRVVQTGMNQYSLSMLGKNLNPLSDLFISGFKINDQLLPDQFTFDVQLVNPNGTIRNQNRYNNVTPGTTGAFFEVSIVDPLPMMGVQLRVNNLRLGYSPQALQNFNNRVQLIRDYRNTNLNFYIQSLKNASWNNIDSIESLKRTHYAAEIAYKEFSLSNFQQLNADPDGKFQQSGELKFLIDLYQNQLNTMSTNAPGLLYAKGVEQLKAGNNSGAGEYFRKSNASVAGGFMPAGIMQSRVLAAQGNSDSASKLLNLYIGRIPDSLKADAVQSASIVFASLQNGVQSKVSSKNYTEAMNLIYWSETICGGYKPAGCELTLQKCRKSTVDASYKQWVADAKVSAASGDYNKAEEKIKQAQTLQSMYPSMISMPQLAEQTMLGIKQNQYDKLIASAKSAVNTDMPELAFDQFQQAQGIQNIYRVKTNPELAKLTKNAARLKVIKGFKTLDAGLNNMPLTDARKLYSGLISVANFNGLQQDAEIKKWTNEMSKKLGSKECEEAKVFCQNTEAEAKELVTSQKFSQAAEKYKLSLAKISSVSYCGMDSLAVIKQIKALEPAVRYEQLLNNAGNEVKNGNYSKAIELLNQSEELYNKEKLNNVGVNAPNREEWTISQTTDAFFGYQVADYYYKQKDYNASIRLVKWSIQNGMSYKLTKDLQEKNGMALARKDHASKGNSPDVWVMSYIKGLEKKLKYFKKAYLKQWKTMEK